MQEIQLELMETTGNKGGEIELSGTVWFVPMDGAANQWSRAGGTEEFELNKSGNQRIMLKIEEFIFLELRIEEQNIL